MLKKILFAVLCPWAALQLSAQSPEAPHLATQGTATRLMVDGRPFLMLGGELGNSTAASLAETGRAFSKLQAMGLNTVLVPVYWDLTEPRRGQFDYTLVDGAIELARRHDLKLVLLWFGSWKNSMSCYAPLWVKQDYRKYPRAVTRAGEPLEMMSAFSRDNMDADRNAFRHLMSHLAEVDGAHRTVVMVQVENEIGMLVNAREYGAAADRAFRAQVPRQLVDYLVEHKASLHPRLAERWAAGGNRTCGTWAELFGEGLATDEIFMAWHYGAYVQEVARAGREAYDLPMYLNAALDSRGRSPGEYPSAGPLAHLLDVWRAAAPAIDFIAPDIYDPGFADWCARYDAGGNPLFIPEIRLSDANASQVFYAFGRHDAMGFSPFSIENAPESGPLSKSYSIMRQLLPLLARKQGMGMTDGFLFDGENTERAVERNRRKFTFRHDHTLGWNPASRDGSPWPETGAILVELSPDEYLVAGTGVVVTFATTRTDGTVTGIGEVDRVELRDGDIVRIQRLSGDQTHQGRHVRIPEGTWDIQYVRLYDYK